MSMQMEEDTAPPNKRLTSPATSQSIDWYQEGQTRIVRVDGVEVRVRFIGRKGRRARILLEAPPGAMFETGELPN
jgi:hypothetical protein